jgi:hypothetical protein
MLMRDLPLESCLTVTSTTSLAQFAALASRSGARYVVVRAPDGGVKGVQLMTVANWMADEHPTATAEHLPVVQSVQVPVGMEVLDVLTLLADSTASVLLVPDAHHAHERDLIIQRSLLEMSAGAHATVARRRGQRN